jgi:hypothetical protein
VGVNDFQAMNNSLTIMANRRPTPNVLALYLPYISQVGAELHACGCKTHLLFAQEYVIAVSDVLTATKCVCLFVYLLVYTLFVIYCQPPRSFPSRLLIPLLGACGTGCHFALRSLGSIRMCFSLRLR